MSKLVYIVEIESGTDTQRGILESMVDSSLKTLQASAIMHHPKNMVYVKKLDERPMKKTKGRVPKNQLPTWAM